MNGHYKCVDALIRYGVEVNTRFDFPLYNGSKIASTLMTPIMLACMYGHNQMVHLLLAYKADCMLTDSSDSNVLHYALSEGPNAVAVFTILHTLLEETDLRKLVLIADKRGYTPLHNACISNHVDVIPVLVSLGCSIDARTRPPKTRENIIERTMHKPINLGMSFTPFDFCKSIRLIDQTDKEDEVEEKKSIGVSGDISKINGRPLPIHMPMSNGSECEASVVPMSTLQISHGTPMVVKDFTLQSTILLESEDKVKEKEKGREDKEKDGDNNVVIGIDKKDTTDTLKTRRKSSLSSDSVGWGITPLHIAVKRRSIAAVTSLIAENADPRVKDDSGLSPLDMAKKLRAGSPILLLLTQAAAALQKLYQPAISIPITIPEESSGFNESEDGIEELIVKKLPTPKNVPKNISQNIPGNITEKAVSDCSARNRVIENHIRGIVQVATQNVIRKTVKNTQKS